MSSKTQRQSLLAVFGGLGWPLLLGLVATSVFYALLYRGPLYSEKMVRYFCSHPVSFVATGMFFVGLCALGLKMISVIAQFAGVYRLSISDADSRDWTVEDCEDLIHQLEENGQAQRDSYLFQRLHSALDMVRRKGSAEGLDEDLKYLADLDGARQHDSFALVRIIIWATPMLGFLGTVIGITQALGDLDPSELASSIQTAMDKLLAGLYVAFDTTALALSLSIVLMFVQFLVDRMETQLLQIVDTRSEEELVGRFTTVGTSRDPHLASIERMSQAVIKTSETLLHQQSQLWQSTIDEAHQRWKHLADASAQSSGHQLASALDQAFQRHAEQLAALDRDAAAQLERRWEQWQTALSNNARLLHAQQAEMVKQSTLMTEVVQATGDVVKLEKALNDNLRSLSGAQNFEETVMSLAAAIHLLNARLTPSGDKSRVELNASEKSQGRAA